MTAGSTDKRVTGEGLMIGLYLETLLGRFTFWFTLAFWLMVAVMIG